MAFTINQKELDAVLAEVELELEPVLKAEAERLAKAKDESSSPAEEDAPAEDSAPPAESSPAPEASAPPAPPAPEASAPPADASPAPAPEASAPAASPAAPADPAALEAQFDGMPLEQLKAVYMAAKSALYKKMQPPAADPAAAPAPAAPAPEASAPPAPPAPEPSPALKGELKASPGNGGKEVAVAKAEKSEVESLKAQLAEQNEKFEQLTKAVTILAGTPVRKAVTSVAHIAKSEDKPSAKNLSKSEITEKLREKARDPKLSKADRDAINAFYDRRVGLDKIEHLLA